MPWVALSLVLLHNKHLAVSLSSHDATDQPPFVLSFKIMHPLPWLLDQLAR